MRYAFFNTDNTLSHTVVTDAPNFPADAVFFEVGDEEEINCLKDGKPFYDDTATDSDRAYAIEQIKQYAAQRISALDWKVTRAKERDDGTLATVLAEREAIRKTSDEDERTIQGLSTKSGVHSFMDNLEKPQ
jgi:hypothetical protein